MHRTHLATGNSLLHLHRLLHSKGRPGDVFRGSQLVITHKHEGGRGFEFRWFRHVIYRIRFSCQHVSSDYFRYTRSPFGMASR